MKKVSFIISVIIVLVWFGGTAFSSQDQNSPPAKASIASPQKLMVPPLAFDDSSITVIWNKPENYSNVVSYNVYIEGSLAGNTKNLFYTATGLNANTPHSFLVRAVDASGAESEPSNKVIPSTAPEMKVFDVTKYGAVGDCNTLNTKAIQKAIDECTKGGKVLIPAGTFLSGALFLKSDMTIQIDGTLRGSDDANNYPLTSKRFPYYMTGNNYMGLINAYTEKYGSMSNVRICGSGTVNGSSDVVGSIIGRNTKLGDNQTAACGKDAGRADMITVKGVDGLYIGGLTLVNSADHVIFISYAKNVTVKGITVTTFDIRNADGIDLATSDTAYIFDSFFDTGDDCINFNAGVGADGVKENVPDNNIRVFNCLTKRGHGGVVFGSFTGAWIQNVLVEDCVFDGTDRGLRFKTNKSHGGGARDVLCRDIIIKNIAKDAAIYFDSSYPPSNYPSAGPGRFKNITVKNITCINPKKYGIYINGLSELPHMNLSFSNISIDDAKSVGAYIKYCTNSTFDTITITNSPEAWMIDPNSTSGLNFKNCNPKP